MASKFEKIIESIINDDTKSARALFHEVVVERSRKIYEDLGVEDKHPEEFLDEVDIEETDPNSFANEGEGDDFGGDEEFGGDEADDLTSDVFADGDGETGDGEDFDDADDFGSDDDVSGDHTEDGEGEIEDRVVGLEDAFDDLKAEFERYVNSDEDHQEEEAGDEEEAAEDDEAEADEDSDIDFDTEEDTDADEDSSEDESEDEDIEENVVREYVEKVTAKAGTTEAPGTNTKSVVAGKNDMGGTAKNLNQGGSEEKGRPTPKSGSFSTEKFQNAPNAKAGVKSLKAAPKPDRTSEASGTNKKSPY